MFSLPNSRSIENLTHKLIRNMFGFFFYLVEPKGGGGIVSIRSFCLLFFLFSQLFFHRKVSTCFVYRIVSFFLLVNFFFVFVKINSKWIAIQKKINLNVIKTDHKQLSSAFFFYYPKTFHFISLLSRKSCRKIVEIFQWKSSKYFLNAKFYIFGVSSPLFQATRDINYNRNYIRLKK